MGRRLILQPVGRGLIPTPIGVGVVNDQVEEECLRLKGFVSFICMGRSSPLPTERGEGCP